MRPLHDCRLYGIIDLGYVERRDAARIVEQMIEGGVDLIQLRGKNKSIDELVERVPVEGVHVGQDDHSIEIVRQKAHHEILVGKSTHSLEQARAAQREGADYIGFGPIFATPTKPDYAPIGLEDIRCVHAEIDVPIFCIGGINVDNLQSVIDAGAKRVVMVSALLKAHSIVDYARCATDMLS